MGEKALLIQNLAYLPELSYKHFIQTFLTATLTFFGIQYKSISACVLLRFFNSTLFLLHQYTLQDVITTHLRKPGTYGHIQVS